MRFPRVVRLDDSDERVYPAAAAPGEWAVPGSFAFLEVEPTQTDAKTRQAFRHGFLGIGSFGWSTVVEVEEIGLSEYTDVVTRLAQHFVDRYGAPDLDAARRMAEDEAAFAASICEHPRHTLLAIEREIGEEGVVENFRVVQPASGLDHGKVRIWEIADDE